MSDSQRNALFFPYVDILRAFAAISVVVYHVIEHFGWKSYPADGPLFWFRIGWAGVDLFFVISGFVITLSAIKLAERDAGGFHRAFMRKRLLRIVPLYYLTLFVFLVLVSPELFFSNFWKNLGIHLVFLHNLFPAYHGAINGVNWSIGTEMQFYLLILLLGPFLLRLGALRVVGGFILIAWLWRALVFYGFETPNAMHTFIYATQLPGTLDQFGMGALLGFALCSERGLRYFQKLERSPLLKLLLLCVFGAVATAALQVFLAHAGYWKHPGMVIFFRTLLSAAFVLLVLLSCVLRPGKFGRGLLRFPVYLGEISYGIYLWHLIVILSFKRVPGLQPEDALPLVLLCTLILATLSYHFFERPFLRIKATPAGSTAITKAETVAS